MPGGHQNATCLPKKMLGAHQDARWPPNHDMPTKETLVAHRDARWPLERHVQNKLNAGCPPKGTPGAHLNATWPAKETPGD